VKKIIAIAAALLLAASAGGCASFANNVHTFSTSYQSVVADINADIAATAPDVAVACGNLQTAAVLIAPFIPQASLGQKSALAQAAFQAANAGIVTYCQQVPTNITQVLAQVQSAVAAARKAYNTVRSS
jgi:hypothetical protein